MADVRFTDRELLDKWYDEEFLAKPLIERLPIMLDDIAAHREAAEKNADMWKERVLILNRRERNLIEWLRSTDSNFNLVNPHTLADAIEAGSYPGYSA